MFNKLMHIADSTLVNLVSRLGTSRDKASHNSFALFSPKTIFELDNLYRTDSMARKIVNRPASDMFRQGYYFEGIEGKNLENLNKELKRLKIDEHLLQAIEWARLYGVSYILLATDDNALLTNELVGGQALKHITALSPDHIRPSDDKLPASKAGGYFDKPLYYKLNVNKINGKQSGHEQIIHHSRIVEIKWKGGDSVLQTLYDELLRFASVNANTASLVHEAKIDVIKTPDLSEQIESNQESVLKRFSLVGMLKSNNGTVLLDSEEDYQSKAYNFSGLPDLMREFAIQTAGACDIPYTILFGQSPAGLNSTGEHDLKNYYDTIATYQQWQLRPAMESILSHVYQYLLGGKECQLVFSSLWQLDEKTRSEVEKNNAERDIKYLKAGVITEAHLGKQLIEEGTYTVIDDAYIKLLESFGLGEHEDDTDIQNAGSSEEG